MKSNVSLSASLPFVAGVAVTAFVPGELAPWWILSEISLGLWGVALGVSAFGQRKTSWALGTMLFCCGSFCYSVRAMAGSLGEPAFGCAAARLRELMESIDFQETQTGALLEALLTGYRGSLDKETVAIFRHSGASHLLALSGLHLGILAGLINTALKILGNSRRAEATRHITVIALSGFYTLMCGATPSLARAFLFIVLSCASQFFPGRRPEKGSILCAAVTIQLALDPHAISSLAFQMSYLAVAGISFLHPWIENWYPDDGGKIDPLRRLWSIVSLGISCQITTAPLVWIRFRTFPTFFLLTNLLAMPLCEALIVFSVLLLLATAINGNASGIIPEALIWIVDNLSKLMLEVLRIISSLT